MSATTLLAEAKARGLMLATAESCTGGMVSAAITDVAGSSAIFDRGFVTYTNAAKTEMLGAREATLAAFGAVSEEVAAEMAQGAVAGSRANIAVSITGIAGPGGSEHKPEGRVCFGITASGLTRTETIDFGAQGRAKVRDAARDHALHLLLQAVLSQP
jgi:nicotinamide-nucleotide amidase